MVCTPGENARTTRTVIQAVCDDPFKKNRLTVRDVVEEITEVPGTAIRPVTRDGSMGWVMR